MEHRTAIHKAIDHIEENLKDDLDNASLAHVAGYSEYHFLRVFKEIVHLTPADYIRKRRLSEIARRMGSEKCAISELAFEYGFHSKENFVRAFKREHHILPTDFKAAQNCLKLYGRLDLTSPQLRIEAQLIHRDAFCVIAYPSDEAFPPHFWNKYNASGWSKRLSGGKTVEDYGVSIWDPERKTLDYFIGVHENDAQGDTAHAVTLTIPEGLYAVFTTPPATSFDFVSTIHRTWDHIGRVWLKENGYRRTGGPEFETYIEESRTFQEMIYIPIQKQE